MLPVTRGSRPPVLASFSGLYNNVHCKMYNNVQHCTSPLSSVGGQRATLSGASGMACSTLPLHSRSVSGIRGLLGSLLQSILARNLSAGLEMPEMLGHVNSILRWPALVGSQSKSPTITTTILLAAASARHQQNHYARSVSPKITSTFELLAVPSSTVTFTAAHPAILGGAATHRHQGSGHCRPGTPRLGRAQVQL